MSMVTLRQAKLHLQILTPETSPLSAQDEDIALKLEAAEDIIIDYLKRGSESPAWTEDDVPPLVRAAILLQLGELAGFRGDDAGSSSSAPVYEDGQLSPAITAILRRYRNPALA